MPTPETPPFRKRALRAALSIVVTLSVLAAAGGAVHFGSDALANRANAIPAPDAAPALPVAVAPLVQSDGYTVLRQFTGQIEAAFSTALSFELAGRLVELSVREGDGVQSGQVIARLDIALLQAERSRLEASRAAISDQLIFAQSRLERAARLRETGFSSQDVLDQAQAIRDELRNRIIEVDAALASIRINIEKSVLHAPFDGRIAAQNVDGSETLSPGQPVVTLIKTHAPEVRIGLPLDIDITGLDRTQVRLGDQVVPATLRQIRPDLDPVTRTRTALFTLETDSTPVIGQTATLLLPQHIAARGLWVPMDALQEAAGSVWTVMVVEDGIVRAAGVELLHVEAARAYVRGSFTPTSQLIHAGAHRVVAGQRVAPQAAGS